LTLIMQMIDQDKTPEDIVEACRVFEEFIMEAEETDEATVLEFVN
jgi:hypothetical protein